MMFASLCSPRTNKVAYAAKVAMGSCKSENRILKANSHIFNLKDIQLDYAWEEVVCPICLDFPHNGVLLQCSSYDKGCRPFMCDTDHTHSNCLERFKNAYGVPVIVKVTSATDGDTMEFIQDVLSSPNSRPACPLCRGHVTGWVIIDEARFHLNMKKRCCAEKNCSFVGNYFELQKHAQLKHPHSHPSEIDPAQRLDWENFQQSSEIIDVLTTIHAEVPHGVVLGDYVIEYGDDETGEDYEDYHQHRRRWWACCISYKMFPKFRCLRNRRRSRVSGRRNSQRSSSDISIPDEGSIHIREYRFVETNDELAHRGVAPVGGAASIVIPNQYRYESRRTPIRNSEQLL